MSWKLAPTLAQLRDEINAAWPLRDKTSDGTLGNAAHSSRASGHNPDSRRVVVAIDIDEDLGGKKGKYPHFQSGQAAKAALVDRLLTLAKAGDLPQLYYVIYERRIYSRTHGFAARPYSGANAHEHHVHIEVYHTAKLADRKTPWGIKAPKPPAPKPAPAPALTDSVKLPAIKGAVMSRAFELSRVMDLPVATGLQDFEKFGDGWLLGQSVDATVGEDSIFNRFGENLQYRDRMICRGAGHNSAFATSGPYVWMAWDKISGGKIVDHRVARVRYRVGSVKDTDDDITFYDPLTATQYMHPSLDLDHSRIALRAAGKFHLHDLDTFKAGTNKPLHSCTTPLPGPFQGHASYSSGLWVVSGETNGDAVLSEFSWVTGKQTASLDLTSLLKMVGASSYEPQGVMVSRGDKPTVHVGARFGSATKRRFIVFKIATLIRL